MDPEVVSQEPEESTTPEMPVQPELAQEEPQEQAESPAESQPPAVDEDGIPFRNKYKEKERKLNELYEQMPTMLESLKGEIRKELESVKQSNEPVKYTEEQLRAFLATDEGQVPANRVWAEGEIANRREEKLAKMIDEKFNTAQTQQTVAKAKAESFNYVASNYPDAFKRDSNGAVVGWDASNPLTQMITQIMNDERFRNAPDGLIAAADIAYARLSRSQNPKVQQQVQQLKSEKKALMKNSMVESGGRESARVSDKDIAMDRLRKTGSVNDAYLALKAMGKK